MIYVDSSVFISAAIDNGPEGVSCREFLAGLGSEAVACTSFLTIDEVLWKVRKHRSLAAALRVCRSMLESPFLRFIEVNAEVINAALILVEKNGLDPRDAIHAASMRTVGSSEIASLDADFDQVPGVRRVKL